MSDVDPAQDQHSAPVPATRPPQAGAPKEGNGRLATYIGIFREMGLFIVRPRVFVARRKLEPERPASALVVLAFSSASIILLLGLYNLTVGSASRPISAEEPRPASPRSAPSLVTWGLTPALGFAMTLPEATNRPVSSPQQVKFSFGMVYMIVDHIVPSSLGRGAFPFLLPALLAMVFIACLYPPARFLGSQGTPAEAWRISALYCTYTFLLLVVIVSFSMLILYHASGLRDAGLQLGMNLLQLPVLVVIVRGYFACFSELFGLKKRRLALASVGAALLSLVLSPALALPVIYLILRFQPFWDLIF